ARHGHSRCLVWRSGTLSVSKIWSWANNARTRPNRIKRIKLLLRHYGLELRRVVLLCPRLIIISLRQLHWCNNSSRGGKNLDPVEGDCGLLGLWHGGQPDWRRGYVRRI